MTAIVTSASFIQLTEENKCIAPSSSATIETSVREILKSLGFPVQTNSFYMIIKQLMERIAPIMIDYEGLLMLFNYVSDSLIGDGELDTQMNLSNSAIRGLQLIQVWILTFFSRLNINFKKSIFLCRLFLLFFQHFFMAEIFTIVIYYHFYGIVILNPKLRKLFYKYWPISAPLLIPI